ncbi:hypothetical protein GCM10010406_21350 [Streptomyces thermolineatus]|uniref:Uncharacterized protein n=1 Tax=Streptomyces thermolineatus TaxID=44033 RepID=A0ABN3LIB8_9ACTN
MARQKYDHRTNPPTPIDEDNIKAYVSDLSRKAQAAELSGNNLLANYIHHGINRELDELDEMRKP